ncbi:uncharacterized protein LOC120272676 isoform X2 [Dioscorea cayenensis subsp. rotundata]|uniref:Uncharacterized protein LOC120272676 isoform X2 n=1 Tax=Dioscorea cayennensis subsp. rotundata TaxID=55577 RepID=A0AB40C6N7_DIOCR|nr:uncharacterized protein LOC120272676 isoform X2 [Dioscorea cayenensis subsp. rotundata]
MKSGGNEDGSWKTEMEKEGASFMASAKETWLNIRARIIGQKAKAKNEKEASEADLQTAKMQVQAADEAEEKKKQLN